MTVSPFWTNFPPCASRGVFRRVVGHACQTRYTAPHNSAPIRLLLVRTDSAPLFPDAAHRPSSRDIPSLDGLRAFSIGCVILGHASQGHATPLVRTILSRLSQFGVCVFFVISGYLITTLLWREAKARDAISLPRFYLRRTFRIFPPYYSYLIVVAIGVAVNVWSMPPNARWWPALTYTTNLFSTHFWLLSHGWSLSIEEQFYVTWPIILAMCIRRSGLIVGAQAGYRISFAVLLLFPVLRVAVYLLTRDGIFTETLIFDYVAAGSALALFESYSQWNRGRSILAAIMKSRATPLAGLLALVLHLSFASGMRWTFAIGIVLSIPAEALLIALFIAWCVRNPQHVIGRILNMRMLRVIGVGSYSLYLWQQMFFGVESPFALRWSFFVRLVGAGLCAAASYWLVERPSLRLRARIERRVFASGV